MKPLKLIGLLAVIGSLGISSCNQEDDTLTIPDSYNFENVNYDGQAQRLAMLFEIENYLKTANSSGVTLDAQRLKAMYANDAGYAGWQGAYDTSKQLKGKTFEFHQQLFEQLWPLPVSGETVAPDDPQYAPAEATAGLRGWATHPRLALGDRPCRSDRSDLS